MKVRFAVSLGMGPPQPDLIERTAEAAEAMGFDTLWFSDVPALPSADPLLATAYAAACTRRVKLGVNLIPFGYQPAVFARQVAQLDQLAAGRLLVTLVPGLDLPGERAALGITGQHRGRLLDELIPELREWWGGTRELPVRPVQDPLEIWLGGHGPEAVRRAGRLADGWLGSLVAPDRAGQIREAIQGEAARAGRIIDPEHFGLSIAYGRDEGDLARAVRIRRPRAASEPELTEVVPVGRDALRTLVRRLVDEGLSKFVVRRVAPVEAWPDELEWLAGSLLDLQT